MSEEKSCEKCGAFSIYPGDNDTRFYCGKLNGRSLPFMHKHEIAEVCKYYPVPQPPSMFEKAVQSYIDKTVPKVKGRRGIHEWPRSMTECRDIVEPVRGGYLAAAEQIRDRYERENPTSESLAAQLDEMEQSAQKGTSHD